MYGERYRSACHWFVVVATVVAAALLFAPTRVSGQALHHEFFLTKQPDGNIVTLRFAGDALFGFYEDEAGYTVLDDRGEYRFATLDEHGHLVAADLVVGRDDPADAGLVPGILPSDEVIFEQSLEIAENYDVSIVGADVGNVPAGSTLLEGCMMFHNDGALMNEPLNGVARSSGYWTDGVVPYVFDSNVSSANQTKMREAMDSWEAVANVSFVPRSGQANYVRIFSGTGNWSYVGMIGGKQDLSIYNWTYKYIMMHELAHCLGVYHEQSRPDRDTYVTINWSNIQNGYSNNFDKMNSALSNGSYDFDSIMHYSQCAFSTGSCSSSTRTITVKAPNTQYQNTIGQRNHLSVGDAENMAALYGSGLATMTAPSANGATLDSGNSYTFEWTADTDAIDSIFLTVGTSNGGNDILAESQSKNLSKTVTGLPVNGSSIYVRLWTEISGSWYKRDYTYTSDTVQLTPASITSPSSNGGMLSGASHTFQWSGASGGTVQEYWLRVGTTPNGTQLFNGTVNTDTSKAVTGIPTNGSNIYVILFTKISNSWVKRDYSFKAASGGGGGGGGSGTAASITSPSSNGGTLSGASHTFTWGGASGGTVQEYFLRVGTTNNGKQILNATQGTSTSKAVTGLPTNGSNIYVILFTKIDGAWLKRNYTFKAASGGGGGGGGSAVAAKMTSPSSNGATLGSSTHTLKWGGASGGTVQEYWLRVGTTKNGSDIFNNTRGTTPQKALSGLPTDGSKIYVTLFTKIGGSWLKRNYTYSAATSGGGDGGSEAAAFTSPSSNGATITGGSHTFTWGGASGNVEEYWLMVGTTNGGSDLYNLTQGTGTSRAVTGLPTDGSPIHARLFTKIDGSWMKRVYSFGSGN